MPRLSINQVTTYRWSLTEDLQHYRALGISAIGLWRRKVQETGEDKATELIEQSGLSVSNIVWAGGFTGSEGQSYAESIADATEVLLFAHAVRAPVVVLYSGGRGGHTVNHARRVFINAIKDLLPIAVQHGVTLAIEPMHPNYQPNWSILPTLQEHLEVVQHFASPRVKLAFDTYHLGMQPELSEFWPQLAAHAAIVHLSDGHTAPQHEPDRCRLGEGIVKLPELINVLYRAGFAGDFDVELLGPAMEGCNYTELIMQSKLAYERLIGSVFQSE